MQKVLVLLPVLAAGSLLAQVAQRSKPEKEPGSALLLERGEHHNVLGLVETNYLESGEAVVSTNRLVQVATGLNYLGAGNELKPAVAEFELIEGAAIAWRGQHKVTLAWNVNTADAVQLRVPDGQLLTSQVHGLAYYDTATGQAVLIATVQDSQGQLVAANQILYPSAFNGVAADVRYTYTLGGFEQDIILRESPPGPETYGLNPATTRLEVWTEFPQTPELVVRQSPVAEPVAGAEPVTGVAPLVDETVDFGSLQLGTGRAFQADNDDATLAIVAKQWVRTEEGRSFLIETVAVEQLDTALQKLPEGKGGAAIRRQGSRLQALRGLPRKEKGTAAKGQIIRPTEPRLVAMTERPGLVLDWVGLNSSQTNYVFKGDETYWLTAAVNLFGTNTLFEGGTVLKFTNNVGGLKLTVNTPVTWEGSLYRPVVLTAQDDHSVGQKIGNAAAPGGTSYYATTALCLDATTNVVTNFQLAHLRIAHAKTALELKQKTGHVLSHVRLVNCETGLAPTSADFSLRNALFHNVLTNFNGSSSTGRVEHLTVNGATWFHHGSTFSQLYVTNSLLVDVANRGTLVNTNQVAILSGAGSVFATALAGSNYLASASPYRNAGTTEINPTLALDFARMTTHAPLQLTSNFTTNTALVPVIPRDTDLPDLGYHYPIIDYYWTSLTANNVTLTLLNGVAVAAYGPRLLTLSGTGKFNSVGLPQELNRLVTYNAVQEQPQMWITNASYTAFSGSTINLRFTDLSFMAAGTGGRQMLGTGGFNNTITIQDSSLRGLYWYFYNYSGGGLYLAGITLKNNLLDRCFLHLEQGYSTTPYYLPLTIHNCLISRTTVEWLRGTTYYGSWNIHDNLFDNATLSVWYFTPSDPINVTGYNGFINTSNPLGGSGNKTGLLRDFVKGPLGDYYLPATGGATSLASLINADSTRTAGTVGLYQYATTVEQGKDSGNLDIGLHYVATDSYTASGGFSGTQGVNGWSYFHGPLKGMPSAYMGTFGSPAAGVSNTWYHWTSGANQYCWIWNNGQHPGGDYDSIRAFRLPKSGRALVTGTASDGHNGCGATDGSYLAVRLNSALLTPWINVTDGATNLTVTAAGRGLTGDYLYFSVNKGSATSCDSTLWDPRITLDTPIDTDGDGLADYFEDSNGDGSQNGSDGAADTDGDGVIDRLDARPLDPFQSTFLVRILQPRAGSSLP